MKIVCNCGTKFKKSIYYKEHFLLLAPSNSPTIHGSISKMIKAHKKHNINHKIIFVKCKCKKEFQNNEDYVMHKIRCLK